MKIGKLSSQQRKETMLEFLKNKKKIKIHELSSELNVTRETVRKDLTELEQEGYVKKIYGGAVFNQSINETAYEKRMHVNNLVKSQISQFAASLVKPGDTIYLDYGTTTYMLAKELKNRENITVVTNTLPIVNELIRNKEISLIIPGGVARHNEDSLLGPFAVNNMKKLFVDIGFFGIAGISEQGGMTNFHMGENDVSRTMIFHSKKSIILADHSKFGKSALYKTAEFNEINLIITDKYPSLEIQQAAKSNGCEISIIPKYEKEGIKVDNVD